ncbi:MAG: glycosyltransferase family 2 protein [Planctomycetes bacterium]|nr:glycosyltransferase family 2 protein [Planctomycetota bacterium]
MTTRDTLVAVWALTGMLVHLAFMGVVLRGHARIRRLRDVAWRSRSDWPRVSIVIPARNEERDLDAALRSVLRLDYPDYEVIAVDDRSTDRTGAILDAIAATESRLRVVHLSELPAGWLGKNHALLRGTELASGELLLFTDADVVFEPATLRFAVHYLLDQAFDHIAATPRIRMPNLLLESFVVTFMLYFMIYFRPWNARNPRSRAFIGVGAFNLIRAASYREIGGHRPIALRPDDDVKLGHLLKLRGKTQDLVDGVGLIEVPWYASVREVVRGLEKNVFAGVDYRIGVIVGSSVTSLLFNVAPFIMVFASRGPAWWMFFASVLLAVATCAAIAVPARMRIAASLGFPIAALMFIFIQWRTMALTLIQGGIRWRDTFYPLSELKANRIG